MNKLICLIAIGSFLLTGCCTIRHQPYQLISISSNPVGANVIVDGNFKGVTPQSIKMEPKKSHQVTLEKEGYQPQHYVLQSKVSPVKLSSNFIFPLTGGVVGAGTGLIITGGHAAGLWIIPVAYCAGIGLGIGAGIGLIGTGVDLYTDNAKQLYPSKVSAELELQESCKY